MVTRRPQADELAPARGLLWACGPSALLWAIAIVLIVVACSSCGTGPGRGNPDRPGTSSPISLAPSTAPTTPSATRERNEIDRALDTAWDGDSRRYACGLPVTMVTDALADVVQGVVETDRLSATVVARQYRDERCPWRG